MESFVQTCLPKSVDQNGIMLLPSMVRVE